MLTVLTDQNAGGFLAGLLFYFLQHQSLLTGIYVFKMTFVPEALS